MPTIMRAGTLLLGVATVCLVAGGCGELAKPRPGPTRETPPTPSTAQQAAPEIPVTLAPALARKLMAAAPSDRLVVIVEYYTNVLSGAALARQIARLGASARPLEEPPFVGVYGTPSQIQAISAMPGVTLISPNRHLRYLSAGSGRYVIARGW